jgi:hypothetical protein
VSSCFLGCTTLFSRVTRAKIWLKDGLGVAASDRLELRDNRPLLAPDNNPPTLPLSFRGEPSLASLKESLRRDGRLTLVFIMFQRVGVGGALWRCARGVDAESGRTDFKPIRVGSDLASGNAERGFCSTEEAATSSVWVGSNESAKEDGTEDVSGVDS